MKHFKFLFAAIIALFLFTNNVKAQTNKTDDIVGKWFTENNDAKVEIYKIGNKYYGRLIQLKEPIDKETGKPKTDKHNPDKNMQKNPILGMILMTGFVFDGKSQWADGTIYDAKSGKTYNCYISLESKDKMKVRGYIGKAWMGLGRTTHWVRTK